MRILNEYLLSTMLLVTRRHPSMFRDIMRALLECSDYDKDLFSMITKNMPTQSNVVGNNSSLGNSSGVTASNTVFQQGKGLASNNNTAKAEMEKMNIFLLMWDIASAEKNASYQ